MSTYRPDLLRKIRKDKKVKQEDLAAGLGVSVSTYSLKERQGSFDTEELQKIFKILKILKEDVFVPGADPSTNDFEGFVMGNQVRGMAILQTILEMNAEILAKLLERSVTSVLSDASRAVSNKEQELRQGLSKTA